MSVLQRRPVVVECSENTDSMRVVKVEIRCSNPRTATAQQAAGLYCIPDRI
jgi:hypothetical protein